jgi:hypothetical protein
LVLLNRSASYTLPWSCGGWSLGYLRSPVWIYLEGLQEE